MLTISGACRETGPRERLARWWAGSGRTWPSSRRSALWCSACSRRTLTSAGCVTACPRGPAGAGGAGRALPVDPLSRDGAGLSVHVDTPFTFALVLAAGPAPPRWSWPPPARLRPGPPQAALQADLQHRHHTIGLAAGRPSGCPGRRPGHRQLGPAGDPDRDGRVRRRQGGPVRRQRGPRRGAPAGRQPGPDPAPVGAGRRHGPGRRAGAGAGGRASRPAAARPRPDARRLPAAAQRDQGGAGPPGRRGDGQAGGGAASPGAGGGPQAQGDRPDEGRPPGHGLPRAADPAHHGGRRAAAALGRAGPQPRRTPGDAGDGRPAGAAPARPDRAAPAGRPVRQRPGHLPVERDRRVDADAADLLLAATTEAQAGGCGDRVRLRCDRSLPVRLAPDPVLQILGNLVDNACKYGPEGAGSVWLLGERDGTDAVLAVEDEGAGVPPEERERVFERFTASSPAAASVSASTSPGSSPGPRAATWSPPTPASPAGPASSPPPPARAGHPAPAVGRRGPGRPLRVVPSPARPSS